MVFEDLWQDLRFGLRGLRKSPTFTLAAVLTLALGIGANASIFSVVNALLLRPLPYDDAGRLVWIWGDNKQLGVSQGYLSPGDILDFGRQGTRLESVAAWTTLPINLVDETRAERLEGILVSPNFFRTLGVRVAVGRDFEPDEGREGHDQVVIISDGLWRRQFGADPGIIGRRLTLDRYDENSFTVVGVAPPEVQYPLRTDVWMPDLYEQGGDERGGHDMRAVARLKPDATLEQAQDELNIIAQSLEGQYPKTNAGWRVTLTSARDVILGTPYRAVWVLLSAVWCVLMIACANVANLQLARAAGRVKEIALRAALGASRGRIVRQLLTESVLLALVGGAVGLLLAWWGVGLLRAIGSDSIPRLRDAGIDGRVLAFTAAAALLTGLAFGLVPALHSSRPDLIEALKAGARGTAAGGGRRTRSALVVAEVAVTALLLVGAGLLLKSFWLLSNVNPGFKAAHVLTAGLSLNRDRGTQTAKQHMTLFSQAIERVRALPGVETVGAISHLPFGGRGVNLRFTLPGREPSPDAEAARAELRVVSPEYFEAMNIAVRRGRAFNAQDTDSSPKVLIVNEAFAKLFLRDSEPVGRRLRVNLGDGFEGEVVGVVGDVRHRGYDADPRPEMYVSYLQNTIWPVMNLVIRSKLEPEQLAPEVRREIERVAPTVAVFNVRPLNDFLSDSVAERRLNLFLLMVFASVSLATAAAGIFGVTAYTVTQRTHEIGIRMALGARHSDVLRLVVGHGARLIGCGLVIGLAAAFAVTRLMASMFYGVSASDPATFTLVGFSLCAIAILACYVPASRAARVDPWIVLRGE